MAKFVIECPKCGRYAEASNFIFAKKTIPCTCGNIIDVRIDKMTSRTCAHCSNEVVFDQSQGDRALCPVCKNKINTQSDQSNVVKFNCPQCSLDLVADKNATTYKCPICDELIDVQAQATKRAIREKGLISVIKYEGGNDTFAWKHPIEDFNMGSQLVVHESQEAIFFRDGKALDLFGPGRYTLETQNLPLLEKLYQLPTGGDTVFHAEVYYINQTTQMAIKWGTDSKARLFDPTTGLPIEIGASGEFNLRVSDSRKLLLKLVGTAGGLERSELLSTSGTESNTGVKGYFRALIMTYIKTYLAQTIKTNSINILEIDEHLTRLSEALKLQINETLADYGLTMPEFYVVRVVTPDDEPNFKRLKQQHADMYLKVREENIRRAEAEAAAERKMVEMQTEAKLKIIGAQGEAEATRLKAGGEAEAYKLKAEAEAAEMKMKGYTYQQETSRQVSLEAMKDGIGGGGGGGGGGGVGALGDIVGLGIGLGALGGVMGMTKDALNPVMQDGKTLGASVAGIMSDGWSCECGKGNISSKFCPECGKPKPEPKPKNDSWNCDCGKGNILSKFCPECGKPKPENSSWSCECGEQNITSKFCPECGKPKPKNSSWSCECGEENIASKFCPECGKKQPE